MSQTPSSTHRPLRARAFPVLAILAIVAAAFLVACGGDDDPTPTITTPSSTATEGTTSPTASRTPRPTTTPRPSQTASAEAVSSIRSLNEFISEHGYPPDANFAQLRIPKLGVDASVANRVVGGDGVMPDPQGPADVVWYDLSGWSGMGGVPGGGGNAVFSGHVDYNWSVGYAGGVNYRGPGVFRELDQLGEGDIIEVDYNGSTLRYAVVSNQQLGPGSDWGAVWSNGGGDALTLYTCGGDFDPNSLEYSDRVVVRAERIQ